MVADLKSEFVNDELRDVINTSVLPPLVVPARIEGELAQQLAVLGQDANVAVGYEHHHPGTPVGPSKADVVQPAVVAKGDHPAGVDAIPPDPVVAGEGLPTAGGSSLGPGGEGRRRGSVAPPPGAGGRCCSRP